MSWSFIVYYVSCSRNTQMAMQLHNIACMLVTCLFVKGLWGNPTLPDGGYPILPHEGVPILPDGGNPILPDEGVTPSFLIKDYPHLVDFDWMGYPPLGLDGVPPLVGTGWRYPSPNWDWMEVPPPHQDWLEYPLPHQDWVGVPHCWDWMGVPHPSLSGDRAAERALATRPAVCLLRSRRRTFLLFAFYTSLSVPCW